MTTIELDQVPTLLPELLKRLPPGEEITIISQGSPVAQLRMTPRSEWPCQAGAYPKKDFWMAPDFDAPLDDFKEYME